MATRSPFRRLLIIWIYVSPQGLEPWALEPSNPRTKSALVQAFVFAVERPAIDSPVWQFFPFCCVLVAVVLGGIVAAAECAESKGCASYSDGFLYVCQTCLGTLLPLTAFAPRHGVGIIIGNLVAVVHQLLLAVHIGMTAGPIMEPFLDWDVPGPLKCCMSGKLFVARTFADVPKKFATFYVINILFCTLFSIPAGGLMALAEGWKFKDGFTLVLGACTSGLGGGGSGPETNWGVFIGFVVGVWAAMILGSSLRGSKRARLGRTARY
jgi:hypothetical protein